MHSADDSGITLELADENATLAFAQHLASALLPGLVIYLHGDLGAGKTTLVRGVLTALGYRGRIKSPTYTLLEPYSTECFELRHFDLYRLNTPGEWDEAGFADEYDRNNILLIEWPEQGRDHLPPADLELRLTIPPTGRTLALSSHSQLGEQCLTRLQN